jgi:predicted nucleic acid-binding protein
MRIYLDNCVLNRPFDDQTQERIYLETQSFLILLKYIEEERMELVRSVANIYESDKITDFERKEKIKTYLELAKYTITLDEKVERRSKNLTSLGLIGMDALHISLAEKEKVDYFISCDDKLIKKAKKNKNKIHIRIISLFEFNEVVYNVKDD